MGTQNTRTTTEITIIIIFYSIFSATKQTKKKRNKIDQYNIIENDAQLPLVAEDCSSNIEPENKYKDLKIRAQSIGIGFKFSKRENEYGKIEISETQT